MSKDVYEGNLMLCPCPAVLVTSGSKSDGVENVLTISWTGILSSGPEYVSVAVRPHRYSYNIIKKYMELGINIPGSVLVKKVDYCGSFSGRKVDKFEKCNFTKFYCDEIKAPLIEECCMNLACKVDHIINLGEHHVFIARIVKKFISRNLPDNLDALAYVTPYYYSLNPEKLWRYGQSASSIEG